jgi:hypothetical protein
LKCIAPSFHFHTRKAVSNMTLVMSVKETRTRKTSTPPWASHACCRRTGCPARRRLGHPRRDPRPPPPPPRRSSGRQPPPPAFFASASPQRVQHAAPELGLAGFDAGGSAYLPSTRAARSRSRAVSGSLGATPLALANYCGGCPLPGVTGNLSALGT